MLTSTHCRRKNGWLRTRVKQSALLQKNIEAMRQRGYSLEDIATILAERGVEIASPTRKVTAALERREEETSQEHHEASSEAIAGDGRAQERGSIAAKAVASLGASVDAAPTSGTMTVRPDRAQI